MEHLAQVSGGLQVGEDAALDVVVLLPTHVPARLAAVLNLKLTQLLTISIMMKKEELINLLLVSLINTDLSLSGKRKGPVWHFLAFVIRLVTSRSLDIRSNIDLVRERSLLPGVVQHLADLRIVAIKAGH